MTRDQALTVYRPIRAGIQRILKAAVKTCSDADVKRAAKHLRVWSDGRIEVPSESAMEMVSDLALFEPNQRGKRAYDCFLRDPGRLLIQPILRWLSGWRARGFRSSAFSVVMTLQACG